MDALFVLLCMSIAGFVRVRNKQAERPIMNFHEQIQKCHLKSVMSS